MLLNFSSLFKHTKQIGAISPDGRFIAISIDERLTIRNQETLKIVSIFETPYTSKPEISEIAWSPDSNLIFTANYKENRMHIWAVFGDKKKYNLGIVDEVQDIQAARWSPRGDSILTWSEFKLRLTIWNLVDGTQKYIQYPKYFKKGIAFHPKGSFMALLQRLEHKDQIGIYSTHSWTCVKMIPIDTIDSQGLEWSCDGNSICVWDTIGNVWLLNNVTWKPIATFSLKSNITAPRVEILKETPTGSKYLNNQGAFTSEPNITEFEQSLSPATVEKSFSADLSKPELKTGISNISFNADGSLKVVWSPVDSEVVSFVTGNSQLYMWKYPAGAYGFHSAADNLEFTQFQWNSNGSSVLLFDKNVFTVATIP
ncbi:hypothetical protein BB559_005474 [Furculomyces boomerangus]|uniref:Translation initiation factor beta propellor-like domain-containing protein n=1 Tax=Furculomyces boomerangus TaxID=61424 RepID=A0A2T9Y8I8_9FUNG|nr:hypothetical protein BB559_005474 [Furculomyces boomerangus]